MKNHFQSMKYSIRVKLTMILTAVVFLIVVLMLLMNLTFYPMYYRNNKSNQFFDMYKQVKEYYLASINDAESRALLPEREMNTLCEKNQTNIYVFTPANLGDKPYPIMFYSSANEKGSRELVIERWLEIAFPDRKRDVEVLDSSKLYEICQRHDESTGADYLELFAVLDQDRGVFILIRSSLVSMQQGIHNTNVFLTYVGIFIAFIGFVALYFISKRFTGPILSLADIAKRMSNLDFTVKYEVKSQDEIGVLGQSINTLSDQLETTISELKTANNELKLDNDRKTQIDEMRKEFLSNVSHELKTPIALIQGYAEGLMENITEDQESRDFYCEVIVDEANKMNKMVKKLLTLNQIEFGNNFIQIERFDIVQMMLSVLNSTHILFEQKGVQLLFDYKEPVYVWSDEYMVEEVFTNFVSNALNHVSGEKIVRIQMEPMGNNLRISVFNTGKCIPQEELEKIWIKFYKVDKARTREYGGNGIGLSIVSAAMKSLNHDFGVYNTENGVCFWFEVDSKNKV